MVYINVINDERYEAMLDAIGEADYVTYDIETTGLNPREHGARIVSASWTEPDERTWVIPLAHPQGPWGYEWKIRLRKALFTMLDNNVKVIAHNAPFDVLYSRYHVDVDLTPNVIWDTMNIAHILNENASKKLKNRAAQYMGGDWGIDVSAARDVAWYTLSKYNAQDTVATLRLFLAQYKKIKGIPTLDSVRKMVLAASRTLMDATHLGMKLDTKSASIYLAEYTQTVNETEHLLMERAKEYGMDPDRKTEKGKPYWNVSWAPTALWFQEFTERAVSVGDLSVVEYTGTGNPSWAQGVLSVLRDEGSDVAAWLLNARHAEKRAQFLESWLELARLDPDDRVHASYNTARTRTGRLSSSDPNHQQVARDLKPVYRASDGWWFVEIDYSQAELRTMAEFIHRYVLPDNPMLQAYLDNLDLHKINATLVTGGNVEDVTPDERQKGKAVGFGYLFGMWPTKFVTYAKQTYGVDFTESEAQEIRHGFFERWEGLAGFHNRQRDLVREQGYVENLFGRRRRLPEAYSDDKMTRLYAERQAINAPIQSTASDMMLHALGQMYSLPHNTVRVVGTVHDSVLMEVRDLDILDEVATMLLTPPIDLTVPLEVDVSIGKRWGEYTQEFSRRTNK